MADLLSNSERTQILSDLRDATDTFFKTPVTIRKYGVSGDIHREDKADQQLTEYDLFGLVEWVTNDNDLIEGRDGVIDHAEGKISLNYEDIEEAYPLATRADHTVIFEAEKDYVILNDGADLFRILKVSYEGPLTDQPVLVTLYIRKQEHDTDTHG